MRRARELPAPRTRIPAFLGAGVALAVAAAVLAGCAEPPRPQPSATALPGGIEASIVQLRSDVADRQAQLRVHNTDDEPLTIGTVRVDDPRFLGHAVRTIRRQTTIAPGATVDIRIQLPAMDCPADGTKDADTAPDETSPEAALTPPAEPESPGSASPGESSAAPGSSTGPRASASPRSTAAPGGMPTATSTRATVGYQFGASIAIAVAQLSEPVPFLSALYARECLGERLSDIATVELGAFTPSPAGQPADLAVQVTPTGEGAATLVGIRQTNLLSFGAVDAEHPAVYPIGVDVGAGSVAQTLHLPLVPGRCDAHALQEDKRGTVFTLDMNIDGRPGVVQLAASPAQRGEILAWVSAWCGIG